MDLNEEISKIEALKTTSVAQRFGTVLGKQISGSIPAGTKSKTAISKLVSLSGTILLLCNNHIKFNQNCYLQFT